METLRRLDEDIRSIGEECTKKYPEVLDASERAIVVLKSMRETYVAEVMKNAKLGSGSSSSHTKFRSSAIVAPYILLCNHGDATVRAVRMLC